MKYPPAQLGRSDRNKRSLKTLADLSHKIRNQASYVTLSSFTLRVALETTLSRHHLEDFIKIERTVDELQRNLKTLLDLIDNNLSRATSISERERRTDSTCRAL